MTLQALVLLYQNSLINSMKTSAMPADYCDNHGQHAHCLIGNAFFLCAVYLKNVNSYSGAKNHVVINY